MYAIVEIAGKQYKVRENDKLIVPRLSGDVDDTVTFDRVLLFANGDDDVRLGTPVVPDASVTATIVEHVKGDKVLVFRKKRRKRFKVKRGHRQPYTRIEVSGLSADGSRTNAETNQAEKKTAKKKTAKKKTASKATKSTKAAEEPDTPEAGAAADANASSGESAAPAGAATNTAEAPAEAGKAKARAQADGPTAEKADAAQKSKKSAQAAASDDSDSAEDKASF